MVCQLRFYFPLLPRAANCTLMSSCFFACSVLDDTGGQDGLRRDGRPSFATCSIDQHQSATTNDAGSSTPRTHRGHLLTAEGAGVMGLLLLLPLTLPDRALAHFLSSETRFQRSTCDVRPRRACGRVRPWQVWHRSVLRFSSPSRARMTSARDA
jgi:hypothetical protein